MGKMLEVFKQPNLKVASLAEGSSVLPTSSPEAPAPLEGGEEAEMPFIEVGGRNEKMEASADVMACAAEAGPITASLVQHAAPKPRGEAAFTARAMPPYRSIRLQQAAVVSPKWVFFSPRFAAELVVAYDPRHPVSAQYEALLTRILDPLGGKQAPVLHFLGAAEQCGTTTTVLNLAVTAAHRTDQTVTLIDGNARRPALAQRIGLEPQHTESTWFQARKPANLRFVPWPQQTHRSLAMLLETLRTDEGLILVDGPNLKDLSAAEAALPCDGLYLVARAEGNPTLAHNLGRPVDGWIINQ